MAAPSTFTTLLLGPDRAMRNATYLCVSSFIGYLLYGLIAAVQVHYGYADATLMAWNSGAALGVCVLIYALLRSGVAARIRADPTLGRTQLVLGIVCFWTTYALSGPVAPATTIIVASHIVYAMFGMPAREVWRLAAVSLLALAAIMAGCHLSQPVQYPAGQQVVALLYTTLVVLLIASLASRVTHMQSSLRDQRSRLEDALVQLRQMAECDELTRLPNRRKTSLTIESALADAPASRGVGCLALLDIDHFKRINDSHGHPAGDAVLRQFASICSASMREGDHVGRWGGEEFLVFIPGADVQVASKVLQRLRAAVAEAVFMHGGSRLAVSFSAGTALHEPGESVEACLDRADQALYRAKQAGRDRVEFAAGVEDTAPA